MGRACRRSLNWNDLLLCCCTRSNNGDTRAAAATTTMAYVAFTIGNVIAAAVFGALCDLLGRVPVYALSCAHGGLSERTRAHTS